MLLFTQGLLNRKHEYLIAVETEIRPNPEQPPETFTHVLHNINNPLQMTPKERDIVLESLVDKLKKQGLKPKEIHCVDLGPMGSKLNRANKLQYLHRDYGNN